MDRDDSRRNATGVEDKAGARLARLTRRAGLLALAGGAGGLVAGCSNVGFGPGASQSEPPLAAPTSPVETQPLPGVAGGGDMIGNGPVKVGVVLPLTGANGPSAVGKSLRDAIELATLTAGAGDVTFMVFDDHSTPEGTRAATQAALAGGAELILGPLFAANVKEAGRLSRAANRPLIGFSTDVTAAAPGVYLLSFLVESYVERVVAYAAQQGKKSLAAMAPEGEYGAAAMAAVQTSAAAHGVRVMAAERYTGASLKTAARKIAGLGDSIDALFIGEQADGMGAVAQALTGAGLSAGRVQILGTGLWNDTRALRLPQLQGAWFASPEAAGFIAFAQRYRAKFGADPVRIGTLAYDAASLAIALARVQGAARYATSSLTAPTGFQGADGVFRLRADGLNERGFAVMQIVGDQARAISAAPRSFAGAQR